MPRVVTQQANIINKLQPFKIREIEIINPFLSESPKKRE